MGVPIRLAHRRGSEEGRLLDIERCNASLLVQIPPEAASAGGWRPDTGFGPWHREGLVFPSVEAAKSWVRDRLPGDWKPFGG